MADLTSPIVHLPNFLRDKNIQLRVTNASLFPLIAELSDFERLSAREYLGPEWTHEYERYFIESDRFCKNLVSHFERLERQGRRLYWIYSEWYDHLVGCREIRIPPGQADVFAFNCMIFKEYRRHGFSTASAQILSDRTLLDPSVSCICAETEFDNEPAARALQKAGFTEVASGLCTTSVLYPGIELRRFMKSTQSLLPTWPIQPT